MKTTKNQLVIPTKPIANPSKIGQCNFGLVRFVVFKLLKNSELCRLWFFLTLSSKTLNKC
jgi:hypothetical protein